MFRISFATTISMVVFCASGAFIAQAEDVDNYTFYLHATKESVTLMLERKNPNVEEKLIVTFPHEIASREFGWRAIPPLVRALTVFGFTIPFEVRAPAGKNPIAVASAPDDQLNPVFPKLFDLRFAVQIWKLGWEEKTWHEFKISDTNVLIVLDVEKKFGEKILKQLGENEDAILRLTLQSPQFVVTVPLASSREADGNNRLRWTLWGKPIRFFVYRSFLPLSDTMTIEIFSFDQGKSILKQQFPVPIRLIFDPEVKRMRITIREDKPELILDVKLKGKLPTTWGAIKKNL